MASASYSPRLESSRAQRARGAGERRSARHVTPFRIRCHAPFRDDRDCSSLLLLPLYERDKTVAPVQRTVDRPEEACLRFQSSASRLQLRLSCGVNLKDSVSH